MCALINYTCQLPVYPYLRLLSSTLADNFIRISVCLFIRICGCEVQPWQKTLFVTRITMDLVAFKQNFKYGITYGT